ncbi:MAG TPA: GTPase HflX [Hyphomicrobiales bacterium]|nr:GTPase HflX [Kaistiaceae bacterium]HQF30328.1 GTPase HflX [Hyphomicrobiales bacterium]
MVIAPALKEGAARRSDRDGPDRPTRPPEARLEEAVGLAAAIGLEVADSAIVPIADVKPATLIGTGKVEELKGRIAAKGIGLVVVDQALTPIQQRNLEKAWDAKVIDRTGLILEIFGERARTREGRLQVELAHLTYQKSRLVRGWTHLERQRGGFGFLGGPGETQIEADRRQLQERIAKIQGELEDVRRTRALHRSQRRKVPHPIVALVGYTNAGKSTLFNAMTASAVFAENLLFATLDPTLRRLDLPHGKNAILSDTVGFISDLPTHLVAAFRATLEEVLEADLILHVRDISHEDSAVQAADVRDVLEDLGVDAADADRVVEVWNKIDLISAERREAIAKTIEGTEAQRRPILVSAVTGEGIAALKAAIEQRLSATQPVFSVTVAASDGAGLAWLHEHCEVLERETRADGSSALDVRVPEKLRDVFRRRFLVAEPSGE